MLQCYNVWRISAVRYGLLLIQISPILVWLALFYFCSCCTGQTQPVRSGFFLQLRTNDFEGCSFQYRSTWSTEQYVRMLTTRKLLWASGNKVLKRAPKESGELTQGEVYNFPFLIPQRVAYGFETVRSNFSEAEAPRIPTLQGFKNSDKFFA